MKLCVVCLQVLHTMVSSVDRPPTTPTGSQLILRCKDFRIIQILIPQERDCLDVHASLVRLSRPGVYRNFVKPQSSFIYGGITTSCALL